ncbi:AMP-binding protein [Arenimonas terrae]|uniref:AMP-binding protein n=1 Tax=Arenimonas terrae TaxID=2546226 RepID=A0A5C4RUR3_9GAMM|nr:AMP-binding protein [Arenimonas terrae]TNJ34672.1 AMP-binding protein [Arenimonas terrae]
MVPEARIPLGDLTRVDATPPTLAVTPEHDRSQFLARVAAWRQAFAGHSGRNHALHLDDSFEFAAALFGGWLAGKVLWLPGDTLPATLDRLRSEVDGWAGDLPGALKAPEVPADPTTAGALDPDACRLVLFTSGSTGEPGAIGKTLRQLDHEVGALEAQFGATMGDALVQGTVSHQHIYGLLFRVLWPLSARRRFAPRRLAYNEELTVLGPAPLVLVASPAHLKRLPENQDWRSLAAGLRAVFSSGGPLPADAAHDVRRLWGQAAIEVFGSTETGGIAWRRSGGAAPPWLPLPGVSWRLADGLLELQSPHLAEAGWFRTQDRAIAATGGGFELRGRADRIVKLEERRISLSAIERRLQASPLLDEARVLALPGHRILVAVAAVPSAEGRTRLDQAGRAGLASMLRDWLAGHAEAIALPRRWRFVDALPVDAQGKTSERRLADLFRPHLPEPQWHERAPGHARLALEVTADLAAFEGHFPQAAVLPGVALIDWAVRLGRDAFGVRGGMQRMEAVKFQHLVRPGARLQVELDWQPATAQLGFRFTSGQGVHASGRLRFAPPEDEA